MNKKLYDLMDWAKIEEVVYGECDHPSDFLGPHHAGTSTLIQAFFPGAEGVLILVEGSEGVRGKKVKQEISMELADEAGFFAALVSGRNIKYSYLVSYPGENVNTKKKKVKSESLVTVEKKDPYAFKRLLKTEDEERFLSGCDDKAFRYMGSHKTTADGVRGCVFRVWAPSAVRVSVLGDFNRNNGLENQMNRLDDSGIFELFIPGVEEGEAYRYEILTRDGAMVKKDPYALCATEDGADRTAYTASYEWKDEKWMAGRKKGTWDKKPLNIYEFHPESLSDKNKAGIKKFASYVKKLGYTHVMMMPQMSAEDKLGYHPLQLFESAFDNGEPEKLMAFVDALHNENLGVIMEWAPGDFSNKAEGLGCFDGAALYEYPDFKRGVDPRTGKYMFNFGKAGVKDYLFSALEYWIESFHIDGLCTLDMDSILYLDYYRGYGEWSPNIFGGVEHLEAIEFIKEMNRRLHAKKSGLILIASQAGASGQITGDGREELGFDLTTDNNCIRELEEYLSSDPIQRAGMHEKLTESMLYQYCENYLLGIMHEKFSFDQPGLITKMWGDEEKKSANLKLLYTYLAIHVGRTVNFMGQEYGEKESFQPWGNIDVFAERSDAELKMLEFTKELNSFVLAHPSLYAYEDKDEGFEWIRENAADDNVIAFMRAGKAGDELLAVFNFANAAREDYRLGVPKEGKYEEIFASDIEAFGGERNATGDMSISRYEKNDGREYSVKLSLNPLSAHVYRFVPYTKEENEAIEKRRIEIEKRRREAEMKRRELNEKRGKIRRDLRKELEDKIRSAEEAIASGSENRNGKKGK
ncbi:MAG: 1,4-alpha-glucan branching enzyme [Lachnospiraceae bacterium]|nr:1,4-alpha-glucan branching enzyme [Lachnospiraceae bacterium]